MSHFRKQTRDALVTALTGLTTTGSNIFKAKASDFEPAQIPGLNLMTSADEWDPEVSAPEYDARDLAVEIEIVVKKEDGLEDLIDQIEVEVFDAITGDAPLAALVKRMKLISSELEVSDDQERKTGKRVLTWACNLYHDSDDLESLA